ncbi:MAG: MFS transporter [Myxococcales bacterium]|nr:MFS transporter [Myxococcales bacterium]
MAVAQEGLRAQDESGRLWSRGFALAWLGNFLHSAGFHAYVHLPGWIEQRGAGEVLIGVLIAVMAVAAVLLRPVVGRVMDTRGRKVVMIVGGVVHIVATLAYLLVDTLPGKPWAAIAAVRVVHGFAEAALFSVLFTYAADLIPAERRAQGIGLFGISGILPLALGGMLGDWVIVDGDYRGLFFTTTAMALGGLLVTLPLAETRRGSGPGRSFAAAAAAVELRSLWFIGVVFAMGLAAYFVFLKTYLLAEPAIGTMGMFFGAYALAAVVLRVTLGWLPERIGMMRVLVPALVLASCGLATLAVAEQPLHLVVSGLLCGVGHGFAFPIISAMVVTRARPDERGSAIALFTALFDLGLLLGGPTFGLAVRLVGYGGCFVLAGSLVLVATVIFSIWERALAPSLKRDT